MDPDSLLTGDNAAWLEALHEQLHADPTSLDPATRTWLSTHRPHRPRTTAASPASIFHGGAGATFADADRQAKVARLINAHRVQGHGAARIDPLGRREAALHPELDPAYYGLGPADMDATVATNPMFGMPAHASVREILGRLREVYCGPIGTESMNIRENEQKHWVLERLETLPERPALPRAAQVRTLDMLTRADGFERYLGARFQGY
jgi:2-oxoglutarate dehydrogenase E1 component